MLGPIYHRQLRLQRQLEDAVKTQTTLLDLKVWDAVPHPQYCQLRLQRHFEDAVINTNT
jgi:hypothetical protein